MGSEDVKINELYTCVCACIKHLEGAEREKIRRIAKGRGKKKIQRVPNMSSRTCSFWDTRRAQLRVWVGWLDGAVNRARGVRFRACEHRSDVLFDLSAAEDRRLFTPESARDQSEAYLMLMPFFFSTTARCCLRVCAIHPFPRGTPCLRPQILLRSSSRDRHRGQRV